MARPTPELDTVLAQFAAQPGTTPAKAAQLRAAVTASTDMLALFNRQAAAGQLQGFALESPGGTPNLIGTYDKQAGVITLPASSFRPRGTAADNDLNAVVGVQALSVEFAYKTYQDAAQQTHTVSQDMVANLQATLNGSHVLAEQLKEAVRRGQVQHFSLLSGGMTAGATYDGNTRREDGTPKGINLPALGLQTSTAANSRGRFNAIDMTFVLGHEIHHGFNDAARDRARDDFLQTISRQARVREPIHDYTDALGSFLQAARADEAKAHIAGWNALLSRVQRNNPGAGLPDMDGTRNTRLDDFLIRDGETTSSLPRPGLTFNADGSLSQTPDNIAAMGQHYFDRPAQSYAQPDERPMRIGNHRDLAGNPQPSADYPNYYAVWPLEQILAAEDRADVRHQGRRPQIAIDMAGIGLREDLIEKEGLDLGRNTAPRPYLDTSHSPAAAGHFHHTQDGSANPQHNHQHVPVAAPPAAALRAGVDHNGPAPFSDPYLNRAHAALMAGDSDELDRVAIAFSQSPEGQRMAQLGDQLLAQQQALEQQQLLEQQWQQEQAQQQAQAQQGPAMSR